MDYLPRITEGDKRLVVFDGEPLGATLRRPAKGKWIANVAQGATVEPAEITPEEHALIEQVNGPLAERGVFLYGLDTIENDAGLRVLSELNTSNVGGITQIERLTGGEVMSKLAGDIVKKLHALTAVR